MAKKKTTRCTAKTAAGKRCKNKCAGNAKTCASHRRRKNPAKRKRNPLGPMNHLQDRWSLPKLPRGIF